MSNKLKLNTKDETLRELFGNGKKYVVPKFQRDYSWEKTQWQDLWEDIEILRQHPGDYHYMGYLVLQDLGEDAMQFKVIDGQQRLTTFSLLVLAAITKLKNMGNEKERIEELQKNFIGNKDLVYLRVENKLKLNRNNDYYYREAVKGDSIRSRGVKKTVKLMANALDYFYSQFINFNTSQEIGELIEKLANRLLFTTIYIGDELSAYKVFETLNARGVKLSSADLLKNYLFSVIDEDGNTPDEVIDELDEKWEKIGEDIGNQNYSDYVLTEWNSHEVRVRQQELFKQIKNKICDKEHAVQYLDTLKNNSQLYAALLNANDEFWKDHPNYTDIKADIDFLKLFNIRQPTSLLMASYICSRDDFQQVLKWIKIFSLRYNVICQRHPGDQETLYSKICVAIASGCNVQQVKQYISERYPSDDDFGQHFVNKSMPTHRSNKKARYLLARIEANYGNTPLDETTLTVEHILPLNPEQHWQDSFGSNWQQCSQRLGNMALVHTKENQDMAQTLFNEKKEVLLKSTYHINKNIASYSEWTESEVKSRQNLLAEQAVKLWRID